MLPERSCGKKTICCRPGTTAVCTSNLPRSTWNCDTCAALLGAKAGISINPSTPVSMLQDVIEDVDLILIMSVNPGFGGQAYIPNSLKRVKEARALIDAHNPACELEIDGGIGRKNIAEVVAAGVDVVVMGSSIFGAKDPASELRALRALAAPTPAGGRALE